MSNDNILSTAVFYDDFVELVKCFNSVVFAILCGSIARNNHNVNSDIDVLVCLTNKPTNIQLTNFKNKYIDMHNKYGFKPDIKYPGEIISIHSLDKSLNIIDKVEKTRIIDNIRVYDGLVWAGMLSGQIGYFVGNLVIFQSRRRKSLSILEIWKNKLAGSSSNLPTPLLLKKILQINC